MHFASQINVFCFCRFKYTHFCFLKSIFFLIKFRSLIHLELFLFIYLFIYVCMLSHFSHVWLFVILWTVASQAPLFTGFSRQEYWSGLPCPLPGMGIFLTKGSNPCLLCLLHCRQIHYHWATRSCLSVNTRS